MFFQALILVVTGLWQFISLNSLPVIKLHLLSCGDRRTFLKKVPSYSKRLGKVVQSIAVRWHVYLNYSIVFFCDAAPQLHFALSLFHCLSRGGTRLIWLTWCWAFRHLFSFLAQQPHSEPGSPHSRGFWITQNDAPQSVGLLWTSHELVAETSSWHHTTLTTDRHPCRRWDSNPQSQQASVRRPTP